MQCLSTSCFCTHLLTCYNGIVLQDGNGPLHIASFNGHLEVVKSLIEAGANVYQENKVHLYAHVHLFFSVCL